MEIRKGICILNTLFLTFALANAESVAQTQETRVHRLGVKVMLRSTGKACDTFGSTMQDEHFVCVKNTWNLRYYLVKYRFRGEVKTVESLEYPDVTIRVDENGDIIKPDTTMHGHY